MKKTILLAAAILGLNVALAQTNTALPNQSMTTPTVVTNKFNTDYPNTSATWDRDGSNYRAQYMDAKNDRWSAAVYDRNGNLMYREWQMGANTYPVGISDYYTSTYPNETYNVWSSQDNSGDQSYYVTRSNEKIWFDKDGKVKKSKTKSTTKKEK